MKYYLYIIIATSALHSCSKSIEPLTLGTFELTLRESRKGNFNGDNLKFSFDSLVSDSRCPANAMCVWQGTAVAKFSFSKNGLTHNFNLSTLNMPPTYQKDTTIAGYKIEFMNLSPYPGTYTPPIPDKQVKAEISITKD